MKGICHLSQRWHQQFCRSPSFLGHQGCLQQWQSLRYYRQPPRTFKPVPKPSRTAHDDLVVNEFEQIEGDPSTRRKINNPFEQEAKEVRKEIKRLERESALLRQGPFSRNSELMQSVPEDERDELLSAMESDGLEQPDLNFDELFSDEEFDLDNISEEFEDKPKLLAVTLRIPAKHKAYVRRFNAALAQSQSNPDDLSEKRALWVWYLRCQQKVPGFSSFISEDVWEYLWQSQMELNPRTRHIVALARDMESAGVELDDEQLIGYLDALHRTADTATALKLWESRKELAGKNVLFDRIGVQLYASVGRPSKAQEIALAGFAKADLDAETVVQVFSAWASSQKSNAPSKLWTFYLQLKERTSSETPPVDLLGQITSVLLKAGRQEMALAVFKDMLATRRWKSSESMQLYQKILGKSDAPTEDNINRIGLTALLALPHAFKNKFFFGAWIKWLLGEGKVDDAGLVVELMQEKGIRPDARHLNGIIGAWFREGTPAARAKGEQMGWGMIHARIRQVQQRGRTLLDAEAEALKEQAMDTKRLPRFLQRDIPPATIETFSILLQRYTRQADIWNAEQLTEIMTGPAQIKPNSFILNHWLYLSLRASDLDAMWTRYKAVRDDIRPDLATFTCLWDGQRRNLNQSNHSPSYPTPRQLYKEMATWYDSLSAVREAEAQTQMTRELYEQIIRCFCLHSDLPCTYLALQHMHRSFGILPHDDITGMIVMQVARMLPANTPLASRPRRAARRRSDEMYRAALSNFAGLMNEIHMQKASSAVSQGIEVDLDDTESTVAQTIRLQSIQTFVCLIMLKQAKLGSQVDNDLVVAGRAMGVEMDKDEVKQSLEEAVRAYEDGEAER
ncbi:uncharacterized protein HMPREF1541_08029 [Cyphellophora europaea CBS 101466]|uniref:Pentatricopeptide repeat domain-containing protein n=1 Tax=Cyphellophora europaea (strain CBS 101466) TaxID=1220924 RepID=W2RL39_CYPE1|nr:uncharacterized protein HMPREF1541_08029 [Cyphellophora europaea CBS 101466]ETN37040.1 hypothetical protein HMPREF1541_08029 [Cyphellophora europaea CBS 101466]